MIAIVVAFDNPHAEQDLGTYRSQFALPACTTQNGCFQKINDQTHPGRSAARARRRSPTAPTERPGPTNPRSTSRWRRRRARPAASTLIERSAKTSTAWSNAVNTAASYTPAAISNSWGVPEGGGNVPNIDCGRAKCVHPPGNRDHRERGRPRQRRGPVPGFLSVRHLGRRNVARRRCGGRLAAGPKRSGQAPATAAAS